MKCARCGAADHDREVRWRCASCSAAFDCPSLFITVSTPSGKTISGHVRAPRRDDEPSEACGPILDYVPKTKTEAAHDLIVEARGG